MARHTSKLTQGNLNVANFFDVRYWFSDVILANSSHTPSDVNLSVVQGIAMDTQYNVPFREVLLGVHGIGGGINAEVLLSADGGRTWRAWGTAGTASFNRAPSVAGQNTTGTALVGINNDLLAVQSIETLFTAPVPASTFHTPANMGASGLLVAAATHVKVARDYVNNRWWAAGSNGSNVALWTWKSSVSATGGWTEATTPGVTALFNLAFGIGPNSSDEAIVGCSSQAGIYAFGNAASPGAGTVVDLSGSTSMVFRGVVYNPYWDQWLFVDNVRGESTCAVMRCPRSSIGTASASNYEFITTYSNPTGLSILRANDVAVTVEIDGTQGVVGPWCWFECTNRQVLATPDMGDTWYYFACPALLDNSTLMPGFSVGSANGCLTICNWDNVSEVFVASRTGALGAFSPSANL